MSDKAEPETIGAGPAARFVGLGGPSGSALGGERAYNICEKEHVGDEQASF